MSQGKGIIKKAVHHNALIDSKNPLTLLESKVIIYITSHINAMEKWDGKDGIFNIDFNEFLKKVENKNRNLPQHLMNITEGLMSKVATINFSKMDEEMRAKFQNMHLDDGENPINFDREVVQMQWLKGPLRFTVGNDKLDVRICKFLMPFLIDLSQNFTVLDVEEFLSLESVISQRYYKHIASRYFRMNHGVVVIDLQELKKTLNLDTTKNNLFKKFKPKYLIDPINEINKKTKFDIQFELIKAGRGGKVEAIKFLIKRIDPKGHLAMSQTSENLPYSKSLVQKLNTFGVGQLHDYAKKGFKEHHFSAGVWQIEEHGGNIADDQRAGVIVKIAQKAMTEENLALKAKEETKSQDEIIKRNKAYWEDHSSEYEDISASEAYLQPGKGSPILFVSEDFKEKLERYRKPTQIEYAEDLVDRQLNFHVEAIRVLNRGEKGNTLVSLINARIRAYSSEEVRHNKTNPELILHNRVGRASKENHEELDRIFNEVFGGNWKGEAQEKMARKGIYFPSETL